jgi:hypothetical protein
MTMKTVTRLCIALMAVVTILSIVIILTVSNLIFEITQKVLDRRLENQKVKYPIYKMYYEYNVYSNYDRNHHRVFIDTIPADTICVKSFVP